MKLTEPNINYKILNQEENRIVLEICTDVLVKDVRLKTPAKGRFSNNYFDMVPNKNYTVYFNLEVPISSGEFKNSLSIVSLYNSY
ncbi:hypothetical protein JCM19274_298 [Algibacter lectus]|uniref:Beta-mannosidase Ig-fold domain-containing protein n=1 Tax=Algibacter lectus TaxID=221126 RepID=A0A090X1E0_9FLAO|nr:glycoside hydrolase family 2 protein [Algibacter lectus]GAL81739.1 hypothetical protein JCM19274_298 [Algibacter lectus]